MFTKILTLAAAIFVLALPSQSQAQGLDPYYETLSEYNRIKPFQNPNWERSKNTLKSKVLDRKKKVVGDLNNIVLTPQGAISSLDVDLNRLRLGEVSLNYSNLNISAAERSYTLGFEDDRIAEIYPELLANIETASGEGSDRIAVKSLVNSDVVADDGRRIGKVEEVLFSDRGDRAEALMIRVNYKTVRGESVALPFSSVDYKAEGSKYEVQLADTQADTIIEFADNQ